MESSRNMKSLFERIGRSVTLPISVLPAAGLMLGIGSIDLPDTFHSATSILKGAGNAVFSIIPLLFAIGVAYEFSKKSFSAVLATIVGYFVFINCLGISASLYAGLSLKEMQENGDLTEILGVTTMNTGVFGGIFAGAIAAALYNRFSQVSLPVFLSFFSGERLIPILSVVATAFISGGVALIWPYFSQAIEIFSQWAVYENPVFAFSLYGVVERLLVPLGLNQVWNAPFFFEAGNFFNPETGQMVTGEIARYLAGDPAAGNLAGGYLFKMFGLSGAALAIWHAAKTENRKKVGTMLLPAVVTAFLTGITEPIEFLFLFSAPILYLIHALFAGSAFGLSIFLEIKHSTTFSHGLTDFIILFPMSKNALLLIPIGIIYSIIYYLTFSMFIRLFQLKTLGREDVGNI